MPDAVTIRRLAQEFGVTPMAPYRHVADKDELLAAPGDALLADVTPPVATGSWSGQLRGVVEALVAGLSRHPAVAVRLTDCDDEPAYDAFGIDLHLEGAQALLRRQRRSR